MLNIKYELVENRKAKPDQTALGFGRYFTDHMFIMDYTDGKGWHDARIVPYGPLSLDPACMVFHYAQEMFEGLKAYRTADGTVQLFRPDKNIERMNNTNERLCIPKLDPADVLDAIKALDDGYRTGDIMQEGKTRVSCSEMGNIIAANV